MAYQNMQQGPRELIDVSDLNIVCAECGVKIDKLPFQPNKKEDGTFGDIFCFDCNKKRRAKFGPPQRRDFGGNRGGRSF